MGEQIPTIGRIVHYQAYGTPGGEHPSVPRAAVITDVHEEGEVTVCVLNPSGIYFNRVRYSADRAPGCWSWPPRAEPAQPTPKFCSVCHHAVHLHNPDGSCGCGMDCGITREAR